jgi:hypothetical protein
MTLGGERKFGDRSGEHLRMTRGKYDAWVYVFIAFIGYVWLVSALVVAGIAKLGWQSDWAYAVGIPIGVALGLTLFWDHWSVAETYGSQNCTGCINVSILFVPPIILFFLHERLTERIGSWLRRRTKTPDTDGRCQSGGGNSAQSEVAAYQSSDPTAAVATRDRARTEEVPMNDTTRPSDPSMVNRDHKGRGFGTAFSARGIVASLIASVGVLALMWTVWPTPYRDYHLGQVPFRENRFTGAIYMLTGGGWEKVKNAESDNATMESVDLPNEAIAQLTPNGFFSGGVWKIDVYNGSDWIVTEITAHVESVGGVARTYKFELEYSSLPGLPMQNSSFRTFGDANFGAIKTWWVVSARGKRKT